MVLKKKELRKCKTYFYVGERLRVRCLERCPCVVAMIFQCAVLRPLHPPASLRVTLKSPSQL